MKEACLKRAAIWLPEGYEDATYISAQSDIPIEVVRDKMGIVQKCRADEHTHPGEMAIKAAGKVLEGIDPLSIDLVLWTGSEYKDFPVWTAAIYVQKQLGLVNAWAFDISARCSTNVLGLRVAKNMMSTDKSINRVLLCGGHKTGDLVNYRDPSSRFLYNLSDGGSAMLIERGEENPILESAFKTDGDFSLDVLVKAGGTRSPLRNHPDVTDSYLTCPDIVGMRDRLAAKSLENFLSVIKAAAEKSMARPIDYLALLHMKKSAHDAILGPLELGQEQSIYLDHYGHFGAPDQVLSLGLAERRGQLKKGDHIVMASAGIGYMWAAISIRWDRPTFFATNLQEL